MRRILYLLLLISSLSKGQKSILNSTWNTTSTWSLGIVPNNSPTTSNNTITINTNVTLNGNLTISNNSTLIITGCNTLTVNGNVGFNNGSVLNIAPCAVLIVNGGVNNSNNSNQITINGTIVINGSFTGGNGSAIGGSGGMSVTGSVTTTGSGSVFGSTVDCTSNCNSSAASPLPIELLSFTGYVKDNYNLIKWVTATELSNNYFTIDKSYDGVNFIELGRLSGSGNSLTTNSYELKDINTYDGISYYRLIQTDFNGDFKISSIISVERLTDSKLIVYKVFDLMGQEVSEYYEGVKIIYYTNGSIIKKN